MARKKYGQNIAFMMEYVRKFIDEESSRLAFTLDLNHHLIQRYEKMYSENAEAAEIFAERIGEIVDNSDNLSDDELRDALCDPYDLVYDIITGRACYCHTRGGLADTSRRFSAPMGADLLLLQAPFFQALPLSFCHVRLR